MKKNKLIVSSVLATLMSVSLIGGATYSLFTSESTHNITVGSATVDVQSKIKYGKLSVFSLNGYTHTTNFANGGTAKIATNGKDITLEKMTPGDGIKFNIEIQNKSTAKVKYRVTFKIVESGFKQNEFTFEGPAKDWTTLEANQKEAIDAGVYTLTLNENATTQNVNAKVAISVEAHQFNDPALKETTITFDSQQGSSVEHITKINGTKVEAPLPPTRSHYTFGGWYKNESCTVGQEFTFDENTKMPKEDLTLFAKWTPVNYRVTYKLNDGSFDDGTTHKDIAYDSIMNLKEPTRTGYTFAGWYTDSTFDESTKITAESKMPGEAIDVYAKWEANGPVSPTQKTITFKMNGRDEKITAEQGSPIDLYTSGDTGIVKASDFPKGKPNFLGWCTDEKLTTRYDTDYMPNTNMTLYPKFDKQRFEVSSEFSPAGLIEIENFTNGYRCEYDSPIDPNLEENLKEIINLELPALNFNNTNNEIRKYNVLELPSFNENPSQVVETIYIPNTYSTIKRVSFNGNDSIGGFRGCKYTTVKLSSKLELLGTGSFHNAKALKDIYVPKGEGMFFKDKFFETNVLFYDKLHSDSWDLGPAFNILDNVNMHFEDINDAYSWKFNYVPQDSPMYIGIESNVNICDYSSNNTLDLPLSHDEWQKSMWA